jgi:hypothetical protein
MPGLSPHQPHPPCDLGINLLSFRLTFLTKKELIFKLKTKTNSSLQLLVMCDTKEKAMIKFKGITPFFGSMQG